MPDERRRLKPRPANLGNLSILLAEDERLNRMSMAFGLEAAGHRVTAATDGEQALDILANGRFDLALMDVRMPGVDGVTAARRIRSDASGRFDPDIPIIALTAYAAPGERRKFRDAGMDACVIKPVETNDLLRVIARALRKKGRI